MASKPVQNITRESGFFYALHPLAGISLFLSHKRISLHATNGALARRAFSDTHSHSVNRSCAQQGAGASQHGQKNLSPTKIALHRTRLRFLEHKNFSVLFFYKPDRQTALVLAALQKTRTEKIEKNFSVFHFCGSLMNFDNFICICFFYGLFFFVAMVHFF
ncbi:hypothetical protein [Enterobacter kobei]|uniref:hypothetical protein n=1 Tax=Enterobacter kobei TaxID=208224 RepID=UPI002006ADF5|nr:hypothetical protein [Enterobacter kobei]MCK7106041.1 hypothetical protein [Enterobacter kobei]